MAKASAAGSEVDLKVLGEPRELPPGLELTAYRIVQEALTNVARHAGAAHAHVLVDFQPRLLRIEVTDDGGPVNPAIAAWPGTRPRRHARAGLALLRPASRGSAPGRARVPRGRDTAGAHVSIRVLVVDDQALIRAGLSGIIGSASDLDVIGDAADGVAAVALAREFAPDVVVMDVRMPGMDGIEATRRITATTESRVLILTTFDLDEYVYAALRAGASGFLLKDAPPSDLLTAVRVVAAGDALIAPGITRRLIAEFTARPHQDQQPPVLADLGVTDREGDVLLLVAEGLSNAEIGQRLHITTGTAKTHVGHLLSKLGARDRAQLAIFAYRSGLVHVH